MSEFSDFISAVATLISSFAWPMAVVCIVILLKRQILDLIGRVENLNVGDKSIKFRQAAISGVSEAVEHLSEIQIGEEKPGGAPHIDEAMRELIEDNPRQAILNQWDRVQRALVGLAGRKDVDIDLRSMRQTSSVLQERGIISDELGFALEELYKSCKYARRVYEFDLPIDTVENYVIATNETIKKLKES